MQSALAKRILVAALSVWAMSACGGKALTVTQPATEEGARAVLMEFLKPGADLSALTMALKPSDDDYAAYFVADAVEAAKKGYAPAWDGAMQISPKEEQTELLMFAETTDNLRTWTGKSDEFPGGYKDVATKLKAGNLVVRFKFVKPGETLGMAFDGLVHVNGHWVIMPKPWRALGE